MAQSELYTVVNISSDTIIVDYDSYKAGQSKSSVRLTDEMLTRYIRSNLLVIGTGVNFQGPASWDVLREWQPNQFYTQTPPTSLISYYKQVYLCKETHRSGETFDPTKWVVIIPQPEEYEFRVEGYIIQRRVVGDTYWENMVDFSDLFAQMESGIADIQAFKGSIDSLMNEVALSKTTRTSLVFSSAAGNLINNQKEFAIPGGYTPGFSSVFVDGRFLTRNFDFDDSSGTKITLVKPILTTQVMAFVGFKANNLVDTAPLIHPHNITDISGLSTTLASFTASINTATSLSQNASQEVDAFQAIIGQFDVTKLLNKANPVATGKVTLNADNAETLTIYSDTNNEIVIDAFDTVNAATKKAINFNKYGGNVSVGGDRVITVNYGTFSVTPTFPTVAASDNSTNAATTAFVTRAIANLVSSLVASAPSTLDTIKEIADALGNDANFSATIMTALGFRTRVDAAQSFTTAQKIQGRVNLGASVVYYGNGSPANTLGADGDTYIDTSTIPLKAYGPKASGAWPSTQLVFAQAPITPSRAWFLAHI